MGHAIVSAIPFRFPLLIYATRNASKATANDTVAAVLCHILLPCRAYTTTATIPSSIQLHCAAIRNVLIRPDSQLTVSFISRVYGKFCMDINSVVINSLPEGHVP